MTDEAEIVKDIVARDGHCPWVDLLSLVETLADVAPVMRALKPLGYYKGNGPDGRPAILRKVQHVRVIGTPLLKKPKEEP